MPVFNKDRAFLLYFAYICSSWHDKIAWIKQRPVAKLSLN